ncbi:MAG TPA: STAS domain-containing protein [Candidatus Xenobia bacterium]|jgi:anti-anti-sigma factor
MLQHLDIEIQARENYRVLRLGGDVDIFTCAELKDAFHQHGPGESATLMVDLERVRYIDSMGLGTLLAAVTGARHRHGCLLFICHQPHLLKLFTVTGLHRVIDIFPTEEEACKELGRRPLPVSRS